jgi:DNA-binding transcriptional LysR family regulator
MEVCKCKNITKASESMHVSQPTITTAIKELENELGFQIFDRTNNRIGLTPNGSHLSLLTQRMLDSFDNFYSEAIDLGKNQKTVLRLGMPAILSTFFYERIVPNFEDAHPHIRLRIFEVPTLTGLEMIDNASLDFLIGIVDEESALAYNFRVVFDTDLMLFMHPDNVLAKEKSISKEMLLDQPFVMPSKGSMHYKLIMSKYKDAPLHVVLYSTQMQTIRYMIRENLAVTILYKQVFKSDDQICKVPLKEPLLAKIGLFRKKNIYVTTAMKTFASFVLELQE